MENLLENGSAFGVIIIKETGLEGLNVFFISIIIVSVIDNNYTAVLS